MYRLFANQCEREAGEELRWTGSRSVSNLFLSSDVVSGMFGQMVC